MLSTFFTLNRLLFFLSFSLLCLFLLPYWLSPGMFFDGVTYAAVACNWSKGIGEFWLPFYHYRDFPFMAHPPLLYIILGLLYQWLGYGWWVEEFYNCLTYLATIILSILIYRKISSLERPITFIPFLLLAITPLYSWAFRSTLLDNTVAVFTLLSVYLWLNYLFTSRLYFFVAGVLCVFLSFLVKGPQALFPLIFLPSYTLLFQPKSLKLIIMSLMPWILIGIIIGALLIFNSKAAHFFHIYFHKQVLASIQGIKATQTGRFYLLHKLLLELIPMIAFSALFMLLGRKNKQSRSYSWVTLFLILALAASIPLLISHKQRAFYLVPSLPFFAIAFSLISETHVISFVQSLKNKTIKVFGRILLLFSILSAASSLFTRSFFSNDEMIINDFLQIQNIVQPHSIIGCSNKTAVNWEWVAYAARYGGYTLDDHFDANYFLCILGEKPVYDHQWVQVDLKLTNCKLYKKREP